MEKGIVRESARPDFNSSAGRVGRLGVMMRLAGALGLTALVLGPAWVMVEKLRQVGGENPSNDAVNYLPLIERLLSGKFAWIRFIEDSIALTSDGHLNLIPILANAAIARWLQWNIYYVLFLGLVLGLCKAALIYSVAARDWPKTLRWIFAPILSLLIFSPSQISAYGYEFSTLQYGFYQIGLFLGLLGILRFPKSNMGVLLAGFGGLLASWSYGAGPLAWPVFLLGMWWMRERDLRRYAVLLAFAGVACAPYFWHLLWAPHGGHFQPKIHFSWANLVSSAGWPWARGFLPRQALTRGGIAICLAFTGIAVSWNRKKSPACIGALLIWFFFLLHALQIALFRPNLAHWYTSSFILFWIGGVVLAFDIISEWRRSRWYSLAWAGTFFSIVGYFYLSSNLSYWDKSEFLKTRAPASESCLRNFESAPEECEALLFVDAPGRPERVENLAKILKKNHWSVFGPRQRWTLLGDSVIPGKVLPIGGFNLKQAWRSPHPPQELPWNDFRKRDLFLHSPWEIAWRLDLPPTLKTAVFRSSARLSPDTPKDPNADGVILEISVESLLTGKVETPLVQIIADPEEEWQPVDVDLTRYRGQGIRLVIRSLPRANDYYDWLLLRFPVVQLELNRP